MCTILSVPQSIPILQEKAHCKPRTGSTSAPRENPISNGCRAYPTPVRAVPLLQGKTYSKPRTGSTAGTPLPPYGQYIQDKIP